MSNQLSQVAIAELKEKFEQQSAQIQRSEDVELLRRDWIGKEGTVRELF